MTVKDLTLILHQNIANMFIARDLFSKYLKEKGQSCKNCAGNHLE